MLRVGMKTIDISYQQIYVPDGGGGSFGGPRVADYLVAWQIARLIEATEGGGGCRISEVKETIMIFETLQEYVDAKSEQQIKAVALAKLTPEERKVLGL